MKLSVKLLSGLTLIALVTVAIVSMSHSASAAADGKVYVTNNASKLTTEASPPTGRKTATTVYGTYASHVSSGTSARDIVTNSNVFIVTVVDSDLNTTEQVTSDNGGSGYVVTGSTSSPVAGVIKVTDPTDDGYDDIGDQF
ncbi:MAG: hypothetical protein O2974_10630, partial [Chloroflexi bacterium]|nr:hypothetical protein [Chloroflexota bacterium]